LWSDEKRKNADKSSILIGVFDEFGDDWCLRVGTAIIYA